MQAERNADSAAIRIQSLIRGYLVRVRQKRRVRKELEALHQAVVRGEVNISEIFCIKWRYIFLKLPTDIPTLHKIGVLLVYCWSPDLDQPMFAWFSQILVKQRQEVLTAMMSGPEWQFLVCRLLNVATGDNFIQSSSYMASHKVSPLRLLTRIQRKSRLFNKVYTSLYMSGKLLS